MISLLEEQFVNLKSGLIDEALSEIKKILERPQTTDELRFETAQRLAQLGFVSEAISLVEELEQRHPSELELILFLAELYMDDGQEDKAIDLLGTIQPENEEYVRSALLLADIYFLQGLPEVAEYKLKEALKHYPDEAILYTALGEIYFHEQQYQQALLNFKRGHEDRADKLAVCYAHLGEFEEALAMYQRALQDSEHPELWFGKAFVASQLEEWSQAADAYEHLLASDPHYTSAYPLIVEAWIQLGQLEKANDYVELGLTYDQQNPHLFYLKGEICLRQGKKKEARQLFEQTVAMDDSHTKAMEKLLTISIEEEDWQQSLGLIENMLEQGLGSVDLFVQQGLVYEQLEEWEQAKDSYRQALEYDQNDLDALHCLASLLRAEGLLEEAVKLWRKSISIDPDQWEVVDILHQLELDGY